MDGYRCHAHLFQRYGQFHGVDAALIPAPAHFHRHGDGGGFYHRFGYPGGLADVTHQGAAVAVGHHFAHRAAHVDVDEVGPGDLGGHDGGLCHADGIAAEDLGGSGMLAVKELQKAAAFAVLIAKGLGTDHLRHRQTGTQLAANFAESQIRNAGHGSQYQTGRDVNAADLHGDTSDTHTA